MLRNIPNRVDQKGLKEILDKTSKGRYDFMYLRIGMSAVAPSPCHLLTIVADFANNCNVGYAFINFVDVSQ
jgi:hypothetical protein